MSYTLEQFAHDCRDILSADGGPAGRDKVRQKLEALLIEQDFVTKYCGPEVAYGKHVLYEDRDLGFQILAHINREAHVSPPHDHGASWAIYGQATGYTDMIEWERIDDGSAADRAKLRPARKYRLTPGKAGIYDGGKIHSIDYPDAAKFIRVTGTDLDRIPRIKIDLETGKIEQMDAQMAS